MSKKEQVIYEPPKKGWPFLVVSRNSKVTVVPAELRKEARKLLVDRASEKKTSGKK